jgi:hypothetical protein
MNKLDYKRFYSELGKLLYAVADVDKVITPEEKKELQEMVRNELVPAEKHTDEFGTSAAHYAEIEFDFLEEQIIDSQTALQSFLDYVDDHPQRLHPARAAPCTCLRRKKQKGTGTACADQNATHRVAACTQYITAGPAHSLF